MPIVVPRLENTVQESGFPQARVANVATEDSFGGGAGVQGLAQATHEASQIGTEIALNEKKKADDTATQEAWTKMVQVKNRLLYDPKDGAIARKGKDALGVPEEFGEQFDKQVDDIQSGLSRDQQQMFAHMRAHERGEFDTGLERHMSTEIQSYELDTRKATMKTAQDEAVLNMHDPEKVAQSIGMVKAAGVEIANTQGWSPEQTKVFIDDAVSKTHMSITQRMLSNGDDRAAKAYFEANRDSVSADDTTKLEAALEEGTVRGESQRIADSINSRGLGLTAALNEVRKTVDDPKVRDAAMERVKSDHSAKETAKSEYESDLYRKQYVAIEGGKLKYEDMDPSVKLSLPPAALENLKNLSRGKDVKTDQATWYNLQIKATTQATRDQFAQENLMTYIDKLSPADFQELSKLQGEIRMKDPKAEEKLNGAMSDFQNAEQMLKQLDIKNDDQKGLFLRKFNDMVFKEEQAQKRKLTPTETNNILNALGTKVVTDKGWLWDSKKRFYELDPKDEIKDVEEIPPQERKKIEQKLKARGIPATEDTIKNTYNRALGLMRE